MSSGSAPSQGRRFPIVKQEPRDDDDGSASTASQPPPVSVLTKMSNEDVPPPGFEMTYSSSLRFFFWNNPTTGERRICPQILAIMDQLDPRTRAGIRHLQQRSSPAMPSEDRSQQVFSPPTSSVASPSTQHQRAPSYSTDGDAAPALAPAVTAVPASGKQSGAQLTALALERLRKIRPQALTQALQGEPPSSASSPTTLQHPFHVQQAGASEMSPPDSQGAESGGPAPAFRIMGVSAPHPLDSEPASAPSADIPVPNPPSQPSPALSGSRPRSAESLLARMAELSQANLGPLTLPDKPPSSQPLTTPVTEQRTSTAPSEDTSAPASTAQSQSLLARLKLATNAPDAQAPRVVSIRGVAMHDPVEQAHPTGPASDRPADSNQQVNTNSENRRPDSPVAHRSPRQGHARLASVESSYRPRDNRPRSPSPYSQRRISGGGDRYTADPRYGSSDEARRRDRERSEREREDSYYRRSGDGYFAPPAGYASSTASRNRERSERGHSRSRSPSPRRERPIDRRYAPDPRWNGVIGVPAQASSDSHSRRGSEDARREYDRVRQRSSYDSERDRQSPVSPFSSRPAAARSIQNSRQYEGEETERRLAEEERRRAQVLQEGEDRRRRILAAEAAEQERQRRADDKGEADRKRREQMAREYKEKEAEKERQQVKAREKLRLDKELEEERRKAAERAEAEAKAKAAAAAKAKAKAEADAAAAAAAAAAKAEAERKAREAAELQKRMAGQEIRGRSSQGMDVDEDQSTRASGPSLQDRLGLNGRQRQASPDQARATKVTEALAREKDSTNGVGTKRSRDADAVESSNKARRTQEAQDSAANGQNSTMSLAERIALPGSSANQERVNGRQQQAEAPPPAAQGQPLAKVASDRGFTIAGSGRNRPPEGSHSEAPSGRVSPAALPSPRPEVSTTSVYHSGHNAVPDAAPSTFAGVEQSSADEAQIKRQLRVRLEELRLQAIHAEMNLIRYRIGDDVSSGPSGPSGGPSDSDMLGTNYTIGGVSQLLTPSMGMGSAAASTAVGGSAPGSAYPSMLKTGIAGRATGHAAVSSMEGEAHAAPIVEIAGRARQVMPSGVDEVGGGAGVSAASTAAPHLPASAVPVQALAQKPDVAQQGRSSNDAPSDTSAPTKQPQQQQAVKGKASLPARSSPQPPGAPPQRPQGVESAQQQSKQKQRPQQAQAGSADDQKQAAKVPRDGSRNRGSGGSQQAGQGQSAQGQRRGGGGGGGEGGGGGGGREDVWEYLLPADPRTGYQPPLRKRQEQQSNRNPGGGRGGREREQDGDSLGYERGSEGGRRGPQERGGGGGGQNQGRRRR
ncbi:hypothetical protein CF319_g4271 [Tilletia indica]|nr:hypothetical protein CF319_g4271 [Tilletia indica]